jgi:hypothetical protein
MSAKERDDPRVGLQYMFIQSTDTLRGVEIDARVPAGWNDKPPLLEGPRGQPETINLLKGVRISTYSQGNQPTDAIYVSRPRFLTHTNNLILLAIAFALLEL